MAYEKTLIVLENIGKKEDNAKMPNTDRVQILTAELKAYPAVLDPNQVADIIGISRKTIDDLIKREVIKAFPLDPARERKQYRINKADLIAYLMNTNQK